MRSPSPDTANRTFTVTGRPSCTGYKGHHHQDAAAMREWETTELCNTYDRAYMDGVVGKLRCDDLVRIEDDCEIIKLFFKDFHPVHYPVGLIAELLDVLPEIQTFELYKATKSDAAGTLYKWDILIKAGAEFYDLSTD